MKRKGKDMVGWCVVMACLLVLIMTASLLVCGFPSVSLAWPQLTPILGRLEPGAHGEGKEDCVMSLRFSVSVSSLETDMLKLRKMYKIAFACLFLNCLVFSIAFG